jgi:hypothetical protein
MFGFPAQSLCDPSTKYIQDDCLNYSAYSCASRLTSARRQERKWSQSEQRQHARKRATARYQKCLEFQQEVIKKTTGTHRRLDLMTGDRVTCALIGRVDQMPTELVLSLGLEEPRRPMLWDKYNNCDAKKRAWSLHLREERRRVFGRDVDTCVKTFDSESWQAEAVKKSGKHVL